MAIVTFYNCDPKDAPKTTMPAHLGANAIITCQGRLLLEKRRDSDIWGLIGGGCKKTETGLQAIVRETYEELGLRISKEQFRKLAVYDNPGRIAAFRDGSIWRMVICRRSRNCASAASRRSCAFLPGRRSPESRSPSPIGTLWRTGS